MEYLGQGGVLFVYFLDKVKELLRELTLKVRVFVPGSGRMGGCRPSAEKAGESVAAQTSAFFRSRRRELFSFGHLRVSWHLCGHSKRFPERVELQEAACLQPWVPQAGRRLCCPGVPPPHSSPTISPA